MSRIWAPYHGDSIFRINASHVPDLCGGGNGGIGFIAKVNTHLPTFEYAYILFQVHKLQASSLNKEFNLSQVEKQLNDTHLLKMIYWRFYRSINFIQFSSNFRSECEHTSHHCRLFRTFESNERHSKGLKVTISYAPSTTTTTTRSPTLTQYNSYSELHWAIITY